ncbi:MAG: serine/threonine-protein kinase [Planctomycetales bacterium]|nr:serine/threonine-protein kinase [Planctomycetales bacterium]
MTTRAPRAGDRYGEWVLEERLGGGSHGEVWRARHRVLPQAAALKVASDPDAARRLREAAAAQRRVEDPRIVRTLGLDLAHEPPYLAMEFTAGESLRARLRREGALPPETAASVAAEVCHGLAAVHRAGLAHGALRPENVLLGSDGRVRLVDLGERDPAPAEGEATISDSLDEEGARRLRALDYVAPEVRGGAAPDPGADLYAAGVILFEMLVGDAPHGNEAPSEAGRGVPAAFDGVVAKSYARREARYPSAAAMAEALRQIPARPRRGAGLPTPEPVAPGIRFGAAVARCARCGRRNPVGNRFCIGCGTPIGSAGGGR